MNSGDNQEKLRFDQLLVRRGLAESGEKARRLILAGQVRCPLRPGAKAGTVLPADVPIECDGVEKYVSRGGLKLEGALRKFSISVDDKVCLDVGASTGGFTDCLLQNGAKRVYTFDVGQNQLHWKIRSDPRVVPREGINVRHLQPVDLPEAPEIAVADVSFISLTLILPPVFALLAQGADMVVLIKPQFELARGQVDRGGVVKDPALHELAVTKIRDFIGGCPEIDWCGVCDSQILGTKGNREFLALLKKR